MASLGDGVGGAFDPTVSTLAASSIDHLASFVFHKIALPDRRKQQKAAAGGGGAGAGGGAGDAGAEAGGANDAMGAFLAGRKARGPDDIFFAFDACAFFHRCPTVQRHKAHGKLCPIW